MVAAAEVREVVATDKLVRLSLVATAVFAVAAVAAVAWSAAVPVAVVVDLMLFTSGSLLLFWAFMRGLDRSREEAVSLAGLFFLAGGVATRPVLLALWTSLVAQVTVALVTAAVRPYSSLAFGVLAPVFGLAMLALWGALHGQFPPREIADA